MIASKLTRNARTTIPQAVRGALGVHPGDEIAYVIEHGRDPATPIEDPFASFWKWDTPDDDEAFANL